MNIPWWLNTVWMAACRPAWKAFHRAAANPPAAQQQVLARVLAANRDSDFGRRHGFGSISSAADYQRRVPLSCHADYEAEINRIAAGESGVLTAERVLLFEPTSGSSTAQKLIPYTASLRREFQEMIAPWIYNLYRRRPAVRQGRAYWSISPAIDSERRRTPGGIAIGFDDDTAYLGGLQRRLMNRLLAVEPRVAKQFSGENFRYATLLGLLRCEDLALISVWSPTFLTALFHPLRHWADALCRDLHQGTLTLPSPTDRSPPTSRAVGPSPRRSRQVAAILERAASLGDCTAQLWKRLALISCWADGSAAHYLGPAQRLFPRVEFQPKGLLATECCVSFPLVDRPGAALALRSHFFEFLEIDSDTRMEPATGENAATAPRLAHQLEWGRRYSVVVTTGAGLYRYRLGDVVEVVGWERRCPLLKFIGRGDARSDLVGEKLAEAHVEAALAEALAAVQLRPDFALVVPVDGQPPRYRLYVQFPRGARVAAPALGHLADRLQPLLEANPHYRYAVAIGQLSTVEVRQLDPQAEPAGALVERRWLAQGKKLGDFKPRLLDTASDWPQLFAGCELPASLSGHANKPPAETSHAAKS